jgi:hypothetical protein
MKKAVDAWCGATLKHIISRKGGSGERCLMSCFQGLLTEIPA